MPLNIFLVVNDAGTQGFLVSLPLKNLFFDRPRRQKAVNVTLLLLSISPNACHRLKSGEKELQHVDNDCSTAPFFSTQPNLLARDLHS